MAATITVLGATPAGASGSGFLAPVSEALAASAAYLVPQGDFYIVSSEPASVQIMTAAGVWTTLISLAAAGGAHVYSDGSNVQILNGATAGTLTIIQFRGR
jgi:hypothetical protein